jgi:hemoglobin/transferrin/lactoferrin receptor protein
MKFSPLTVAVAIATASLPVVAAEQALIAKPKRQQLAEQQVERVQVLGNRITAERLLISQDDWQAQQAKNMADLFANEASVAVGGSLGVAQKLYLHGLEDLLLNVSLDGAVQSGSMFHHIGRLSLEPELLRQVEIQAGPGDATQGAGALGGSIDFVSKDAADLLLPGQNFTGLLKGATASVNHGRKTNLTLAGQLHPDWGLLGSWSEQDTELQRDGAGQRWDGTAAEQRFTFIKLSGQLSEQQQLKFSVEQARDQGLRAQRPNWQISSWNKAFPLTTERKTQTLNYQFDADSALVNLRLAAYHSDTVLQQNARFGLYEGGVKNRGFDLRNGSQLGQHQLEYGVDQRHEETHLAALEKPTVPVEGEKARVHGVFLQDYWDFAPDWRLNAGVRFDDYQVTDMKKQQLSSNGLSPNLGLSHQVTAAWRLYGGYSSALRGRLTTNSFVLDNRSNAADLTAEQARHLQLGAEYQTGQLMLTSNLFRTRIDDAISEVKKVYRNVGELQSQGFDLQLRYQLADWRFSAGVSQSKAELNQLPLNSYDHGSLGNQVGRTWTGRVSYQLDQHWSGGISSRALQGKHNIQTSAGLIQQPGYAVHDLFINWQPAGLEGVRVDLALRNMFDKFYRDHATLADYQHLKGFEGLAGLPEAGRDFRLTLSWQF